MKLLEDLDVYAFRKGWPRWASFFVPFFYPNSWPIIVYRFGSWVVKLRNPEDTALSHLFSAKTYYRDFNDH
jgi:hypothetical protein